jgi:membrane protease YdiL (CAAX protease family)
MNDARGVQIAPELPATLTREDRRHSLDHPAATNRKASTVWPTAWLYIVVTWLAAGALLALQPATHLNTEVLVLPQFGPSIAVLVVVARRRGVQLQIWKGTVRTMLRRLVAGAGIVAAVFGLCLAVQAITGHAIHLTSLRSLGEPLWLIAVAQLIGACGEELGWRAFLQPHLQQRYSPLISALIVGVVWGTWHPAYISDGLPFFAVFVLLTVAFSVIMAQLTRGTSGLVVGGVFHWLVNLATLLLLNWANGNLAELTEVAIGFLIAAVVLYGGDRFRHRSKITAQI